MPLSRSSRIDHYGLPSVAFDDSLYEEQRLRLSTSTFLDAYESVTTGSPRDQFLARNITDEEKRTVNQFETMLGAQDAEVFREKLCDVQVQENGEGLVDLKQLNADLGLEWTFSDIPYHPACGEWAGKSRLMWVRRGLGSRLVALTSDLLSANYSLQFEDAFRPTGVQEGLFRRRYEMARSSQPSWSHDECILEAQSKTAFTPRFAAHKAGAAADVRVRDLLTGELVDIGHDYPEGGEVVRLESPFVTQRQWQNRKLLEAVALRAGLAVYPYEDWHLCIGDVTAAVVLGGDTQVASYGPVKEFDRASGAVLAGYALDELDQVFDVS